MNVIVAVVVLNTYRTGKRMRWSLNVPSPDQMGIMRSQRIIPK